MSADEAASFSIGKQSFDNPVIKRLTNLVRDLTPDICCDDPAYCVVESHKSGHDWHVDTGDSNHMPWCCVSASVLLTPPTQFEGGVFEFADPLEAHKHYLDLLIYTSDNVHRVTPHTGNRRVLLMFLGQANDK